MRERVQLCQDPQTEFAVLYESLEASRVNHIFRVHRHIILEEERAVRFFDAVAGEALSSVQGGQSGVSHAECRPVRDSVLGRGSGSKASDKRDATRRQQRMAAGCTATFRTS